MEIPDVHYIESRLNPVVNLSRQISMGSPSITHHCPRCFHVVDVAAKMRNPGSFGPGDGALSPVHPDRLPIVHSAEQCMTHLGEQVMRLVISARQTNPNFQAA